MNLHIPEDILLTDCTANHSVAQMACYAVSLCLGSNLLCRALKTAMVEKYLLAVSRYIKHLNEENRDPRMDNPGDPKILPARQIYPQRTKTLGICTGPPRTVPPRTHAPPSQHQQKNRRRLLMSPLRPRRLVYCRPLYWSSPKRSLSTPNTPLTSSSCPL